MDFEDFELNSIDSSRVFNHTAHKELWNYLAENPTKQKEDWPEWKVNGGKYSRVDGNCFACEFTIDDTCYDCPLIWPIDFCASYKKWAEEGISLEERTSLALQIANLPVKEGIETI